ncbi:MAG: alpha/beta hydrolase [Pseudomonadota bacterium]
MTAPDQLQRAGKGALAYHRLKAQGDGSKLPGVVFLGGFRSDMTGTKAQWIETWCRERGRAFLRFDYSGHGQSDGDFLEGCIGDWAADAADAVEALTEGPQILVGSSMGGWISLLLARRMPERIAGLIGIAAAPDFTEDSMWAGFGAQHRETLEEEGQVALPSDYSDDPYIITRRLIEDGRENLVLRDPLALPFPVRLLQGTADTDVEVSVALRLIEHLDSPDARLTLVKDADHRFSEPRELALIGKTLHGITRAAMGQPDG